MNLSASTSGSGSCDHRPGSALCRAWLWSERAGVISHQTALALHGLSDALPAHVHLTLPSAWRRRRFRVPADVVLHHADVPQEDRTWFGAVPTTSPRRSLNDCAREGLSPELLRQAAQQALRRGLVTKAELGDVEEALAPFGGTRRMTIRTYTSPEAFKQALDQRLRRSAKTGAEFARKRQLLVFDRFLARVVAVLGDAATLKGGLVLELRLERARTTKDVDLRMLGSPDGVLAKLQETARRDLGDFMTFEVGPDDDHPEIQNDGMQYDGLRFRAECKLAGKLYGQPFGVDVAFGDRAEVARRLGFTRARVTHLMDLTLLAPDLQERVLGLDAVDCVEPMAERMLRTVAHAGTWAEQRAAWAGLAANATRGVPEPPST